MNHPLKTRSPAIDVIVKVQMKNVCIHKVPETNLPSARHVYRVQFLYNKHIK